MIKKFSIDNNSYTEITSESVRKYMNDVSSIESDITEETQKDLIYRYHYESDEWAKNRLIEMNLRFVISVAKQYNTPSVDFEDLINEGNIGLQTAVEKFDPDRNVRFISYAVWWIRRNIIMYLNEHGRSVKLPLNLITNSFKLEEAKNRLAQRLGREAGVDEIKEYMKDEYGMSEKNVEKAIEANETRDESIERPIGEDSENGDKSLLDVIPNTESKDPDEGVQEEDESKVVDTLFEPLGRLERQVVDLYYGINTGVSLSLRDVGEEIGASSEYVRQVRDRAEKKIRDNIEDPRKILYEG